MKIKQLIHSKYGKILLSVIPSLGFIMILDFFNLIKKFKMPIPKKLPNKIGPINLKIVLG